MVDQLMQFMNNKLCDFISAYRNDYSNQHILVHVMEEWKIALDNGHYVDVALMDLSKAFNAIPHGLFFKLNCIHIVFQWMLVR